MKTCLQLLHISCRFPFFSSIPTKATSAAAATFSVFKWPKLSTKTAFKWLSLHLRIEDRCFTEVGVTGKVIIYTSRGEHSLFVQPTIQSVLKTLYSIIMLQCSRSETLIFYYFCPWKVEKTLLKVGYFSKIAEISSVTGRPKTRPNLKFCNCQNSSPHDVYIMALVTGSIESIEKSRHGRQLQCGSKLSQPQRPFYSRSLQF